MKLNFSALVAYRPNFVNSLLSSFSWGIFSFVTIYLLTARTPSIFGWSREEVLLLTGAYNIMIGIFHMVFSRNFERLSRLVHFGDLDGVLVKPIDAQFFVSLWFINYTSLARVIIAVAFTLYIISTLHLAVSISNLFIFFVFIVFGLLLLYSLWFLVATTTIWFTHLSNIVDLMYTISSMARFPREMYTQLASYVFLFLLPLTFIIVTPVKTLLLKVSTIDVAGLLGCAVLLFYFSRWFWKFALRYYTSAS